MSYKLNKVFLEGKVHHVKSDTLKTGKTVIDFFIDIETEKFKDVIACAAYGEIAEKLLHEVRIAGGERELCLVGKLNGRLKDNYSQVRVVLENFYYAKS